MPCISGVLFLQLSTPPPTPHPQLFLRGWKDLGSLAGQAPLPAGHPAPAAGGWRGPGASEGDGRSPERGRRGEPGRGRTWARRQVRRPTGEERGRGGRGPRRDTRAGSPRPATAAAAQGRHHGVRDELHPEKGFLQAGHQQDRLGAAQDLPGAHARRQRGLRSCVVRPGDPRRQRGRGPPLGSLPGLSRRQWGPCGLSRCRIWFSKAVTFKRDLGVGGADPCSCRGGPKRGTCQIAE